MPKKYLRKSVAQDPNSPERIACYTTLVSRWKLHHAYATAQHSTKPFDPWLWPCVHALHPILVQPVFDIESLAFSIAPTVYLAESPSKPCGEPKVADPTAHKPIYFLDHVLDVSSTTPVSDLSNLILCPNGANSSGKLVFKSV